MKKQLLLAIACIAMLFTFSCKNSADPQPEDKTPAKVKLLTRIITSRKLYPNEPGYGNTADGYQTNFTILTYDAQKRLNSRKEGSNETIYWYDDKDRVNRVTTSNGNGGTTDLSVVYEGQHIKSMNSKVYNNGVLRSEILYGYVYSGDKIVEIAQNQDGQRMATYTYTYNGQTIKQSIRDVSYPADAEFTYDSKRTPYDNASVKYALAFPLGPYSLNNQLSMSLKYINIPNTQSITNTLTYYDDGLPKTMVSDYSATQGTFTSAGETRFTYEYTEM